jgi:hypothetical protein
LGFPDGVTQLGAATAAAATAAAASSARSTMDDCRLPAMAVVLLRVLAVALACCGGLGTAAVAPWPMLGHDARHSGQVGVAVRRVCGSVRRVALCRSSTPLHTRRRWIPRRSASLLRFLHCFGVVECGEHRLVCVRRACGRRVPLRCGSWRLVSRGTATPPAVTRAPITPRLTDYGIT